MGILGYNIGKFFSGILVYHYPPWPTLVNGGDNNRRTLGGMAKRWLQPLDGGTNVANEGLIDNNVLQFWCFD